MPELIFQVAILLGGRPPETCITIWSARGCSPDGWLIAGMAWRGVIPLHRPHDSRSCLNTYPEE